MWRLEMQQTLYSLGTRGPIGFKGAKIIGRSPYTLTDVEYHATYHVLSGAHVDTLPSRAELIQRMNNQISQSPTTIDGWCEDVIVTQGLLSDQIRFDCYAAATEIRSTLIGPAIIIPTAILYALIVAATAIVLTLFLLIYWVITVINEHLSNHYVDNKGREWNSEKEKFYALQQDYWLVCPKCEQCWASHADYSSRESIPQNIVDAFNDHVKNCPGTPADGGWKDILFVLVVGGLAIGGIWIVGKTLGFFGGLAKHD